MGVGMAYTLSFNDLSENIQNWQGLPLSLSGCEVMPLDYQAGKIGWILYGKTINKILLSHFQKQLGMPIVVVSSWKVNAFQVVRIAGSPPKKAFDIAETLNIDIASIDPLPSLQSPGLLVMDMDSTAITIECIDEIAVRYGVGKWVSKITEQTMQGEIDFNSSLRQRVAALMGADVKILDDIRNNLTLTPGLRFLVKQLQQHQWQIAIVSGGFTYFSDHLRDELNLVKSYANELEITEGKLSGQIRGQIMDAKSKAKTLQNLASDLSIPLTQTVAIGDGANDIKMIKTAALGVVYHAKNNVVEKAKTAIKFADLTGLYCILSASLDSQG